MHLLRGSRVAIASFLAIAFIILIGAFLFGSTIRGVPGNLDDMSVAGQYSREGAPFESSHERAPYAEMISIYRNNTIVLTRDLANFGAPDIGYNGTKYYSFFPSGISYAILPFYVWGRTYGLGQVFAYGSVALFSIFTMIGIYLISRRIFGLGIWAGLLGAFVYGFGSTAWSYSITIYQHAHTAAIAVWMFYCAWKYRIAMKRSWVWASAVWILFALALFIDYPNAILLAPIMLYLFLSSFEWRALKGSKKFVISFNLAFFAGMIFFLGITGFHLYRNAVNFGSPMMIGNRLPRYMTKNNIQVDEMGKPIDLKKEAETRETKKAAPVLEEKNLPKGFFTLNVGNDKGLFYFSPIFIVALIGIILEFRRKVTLESGILLTFIITNFFIYSSFGDPWGGWAYGPRYLVPGMAGLSVFIALALSRFRYPLIGRIVFFLLFTVSSAIALAGALTTNLVPPKVEADYLKLKFYNFLKAFDMMDRNQSGSFVYNTYFSSQFTVWQFYILILSVLLSVVFIITFVLPIVERRFGFHLRTVPSAKPTFTPLRKKVLRKSRTKSNK